MTKQTIQHLNNEDLSHSMAHYLLTIHKLKEANGYARVTDIAKDLGLTKGSVSTALGNLKKKDFVSEDDNKFLSLSDKGHKIVHSILTNRTLLYYFLKDFLGVEDSIAHKDSCLIEHLLSDQTTEKFYHFMKKLSSADTISKVQTSLNFDDFATHEDFVEAQIGDKYLES